MGFWDNAADISDVATAQRKAQEDQIALATKKKALSDLLNPPTLGQELNAPKSTPEQDAAFTQAMKDYQSRKTAMPTPDQAATNTTLGIPAAPAPAMPTNPRDQYAKNIGLNNADQLNIPSSQVGNVEKLQQGSYWAGRNEATATKAAGGKIWYNPTNLSYSEVQRPGDILVKNETAATQASYPQRQDIQQGNALERQAQGNQNAIGRWEHQQELDVPNSVEERYMGRRLAMTDMSAAIGGLQKAQAAGVNITGLYTWPENQVKQYVDGLPPEIQQTVTDLMRARASILFGDGGKQLTQGEVDQMKPFLTDPLMADQANMNKMQSLMNTFDRELVDMERTYQGLGKFRGAGRERPQGTGGGAAAGLGNDLADGETLLKTNPGMKEEVLKRLITAYPQQEQAIRARIK